MIYLLINHKILSYNGYYKIINLANIKLDAQWAEPVSLTFHSTMTAMFVNGSGQMINLYRGPSIDASYQVSFHLANRFQRRRLLEIDQSETRIA